MEFRPDVTEDGKYLILQINHGTSPKNRVYYRAANKNGDLPNGPFVKLLDSEDAMYQVIENVGSTLYVLTDKDAPRRRIVAIDLGHPEQWKEVLPQTDEVISHVRLINDQLVAVLTRDGEENRDGS